MVTLRWVDFRMRGVRGEIKPKVDSNQEVRYMEAKTELII